VKKAIVKKGSRNPPGRRLHKRAVKKQAGKPGPHPSLDKQPPNTRQRIEATIRRIPKGKVSTYGAIASAAGFPGMARQVAQVLHRGFELPWQRVLGAGGEIKLRGDSAIEQRFRLESEGVRFHGKKVDMKQCEFEFPRSRASKKIK
jgi:methylated-DNA-protein-cysteine methyltransferase-like protein